MTISATEFSVDLEQLAEAITTVQGCHDTIVLLSHQLNELLGQVPGAWSAPSEQTFSPLVPPVQSAIQSLLTLLQDMVNSMQTSHANYQSTELANVASLTPS
jgi:WXG100 family type VII secretion target